MPRRNKSKEQPVSLFPFLSVLACVIGVLSLLIAAIALGQVNPESIEKTRKDLELQKQRADEYARLLEKKVTLRKKRDELKKLETDTEDLEQQIEEARRKKQELEKKLEEKTGEIARKNSRAATLSAAYRKLKQDIEELKKKLDEIRKEIKELETELKKRKEAPKPASVKIKPGGTGRGLKPTFVECAGHSLVLLEHPEKKRVRREKIEEDPDFTKLVETVAAQNKGTILFLVRPSGIWTYHLASRYARQQRCHNGKLPVPGEGAIDLGMFGK